MSEIRPQSELFFSFLSTVISKAMFSATRIMSSDEVGFAGNPGEGVAEGCHHKQGANQIFSHGGHTWRLSGTRTALFGSILYS